MRMRCRRERFVLFLRELVSIRSEPNCGPRSGATDQRGGRNGQAQDGVLRILGPDRNCISINHDTAIPHRKIEWSANASTTVARDFPSCPKLMPGHLHLPWQGTHRSTDSRFIRVLKSSTPFRFRRRAPSEFACFGSQTISSGRRQFPNHHSLAVGARVADLKFGHGKSTLAVMWFLLAGRSTASRREERGRDPAPA
jgi:hypothetical protein